MAKVVYFILLLSAEMIWSASVSSDWNPDWHNRTSDRSLSRRKRFLLFPINGQLVITLVGAKNMLFKAPASNFLLLEMDIYYPLPDYRYRIASLRLGTIAELPGAPKPKPPTPIPVPIPMPPPSPKPIPMHVDGQEPTAEEVKQYLKTHPETWVPPGYSRDRSDNFKNIYTSQYHHHQEATESPYQEDDGTQAINLWHSSPENYIERYFPRRKRSLHGTEEIDYELEEEEDRFNIKHHRDWEHFYHYRERRELYRVLEKEAAERFDFPMKACILRSICEVRDMMPATGKSMMYDIVRTVFSIPLKEELMDEYSTAKRHEERDCHKMYGKKCPISIVQLLLYGKLVW
ncbi:uncharacterized protein LOC128743932 [Sabethes cyaneus]|uniref:uncharacterized protein LOC128743932 n=1 Tax=Sabethes cyaneus TaxID=53552 RepID=UPI00237D3938|nr:uncharacterized protein LOC128743932 [Sabethes cyaneus]